MTQLGWGWGHTPKTHPPGHKKPKFSPCYPQQQAEPGFEWGMLSALVTAPGPPDSLEGDPVTDGARHHTTLPSTLHTAGQSCEKRPWPGRSQGNHTCLAPACSAMSPQHPEQLGPPPSTCCRGWTMFLFYQWCRGASRVGWWRVVGHGSEWPCKDRSL